MIGILRTTFYRWYDRYLDGGFDALADRQPQPGKAWNRIPDAIRQQITDLALDEPELSPRELAIKFTDTKGYFVSEASVYRILKAAKMITSPAYVVIKAANVFKGKPSRVNEQWQTAREAGVYATSRISRLKAGVGITCLRPLMITAAM